MATKEATALGEIWQAQASDRESQSAFQSLEFLALFFTYDCDSVLVRQAPADGALQK